ncbi:FlaD/FlaE family flagellar protein [Halobacterium litoreum]|uniref:FlaD/FlaE family flagellar protein n=1 Tax=Halobacterium litoreum TaxID=2039234 RepID=A0ABD5NAP1_9EURY|nr:FlaD/FlaE family flagellar protein [Halobacterium litoreum]UHH12022.1 flagella protein [Halobacterium litoreum]
MKFIHLTPTALVFLQFGALAVGMASWLDDDEGSGDSGGDDEFEMDDDFDDDFDDEFGSFDDMEDGGGGAGGADASVNELEHRIEELETEVSNVASKANTVRSENEQISESVEDVEENVRKLLEIYEMVTRGVNPFVDDVETEAMGGGASGQSFGLFDDEEEDGGDGGGGGEDLDADIADADADDFFEDDAFDDGMEEGDDMGGFDDFEEEEGADDEMDGFGDFEDEDGGEEAAGDGGGTSFDELKEEYESGEADWAEGEEGGDDAIDAEEKPDLGFDDSDLEEDEEATDEVAEDDGFDFEEEETEDAGGAESGTDIDESSGTAPALGLRTRGDGPHLEEHPNGYLADVVSLEWLNYLLAEFGPKNTVRTLNYYERIGWIGEPARDQLFDYLEGLTDSDYLYREEFGTTELTMDDHLKSLDYIEELASEDIERAIVDRCEDLHRNGIQR